MERAFLTNAVTFLVNDESREKFALPCTLATIAGRGGQRPAASGQRCDHLASHHGIMYSGIAVVERGLSQ